jgi:magnesium transporter
LIKLFADTGHGVVETQDRGAATWILGTAITDGEVDGFRESGIPAELLAHVRDADERPRVERAGVVALIVLHFPYRVRGDAPIPFLSLPLTILLTERQVVTIAPAHADVIERVLERDIPDLTTSTRTRFILHLMLHLAGEYLICLREMNAAIENLESSLRRSQRNEEVLELLRYEKSLVYFTTSLASNEMLLERLQKGRELQWSPDDTELLEDVLIEVRQARAMVDISQNILSQMMDAFASIVSNNLNAVMKLLTSMTIIISVPTMIASLYGMNVIIPGAREPLAFAAIVAASLLITAALVWIFIRKRWF